MEKKSNKANSAFIRLTYSESSDLLGSLGKVLELFSPNVFSTLLETGNSWRVFWGWRGEEADGQLTQVGSCPRTCSSFSWWNALSRALLGWVLRLGREALVLSRTCLSWKENCESAHQHWLPGSTRCPWRFAAELRFTNRVMKVTKEWGSRPSSEVIGPKGAWRRAYGNAGFLGHEIWP